MAAARLLTSDDIRAINALFAQLGALRLRAGRPTPQLQYWIRGVEEQLRAYRVDPGKTRYGGEKAAPCRRKAPASEPQPA